MSNFVSNGGRVRVRVTRIAAVAALAALAGGIVVGVSGGASACGGRFCNRPPDPFAPLPVAQNGENVVFAITKDPAGGAPTIQAHIQILYTGDAAKFSWVVPVDAEPKLSTGTDRLFSALAQATAPTFRPRYETSGTCIPQSFPGGGPADAGVGGIFTGTGSAGTSGAASPPNVQVSFQGAVGPFDAAVIKSDDPVALKKWLTDNGYIVSDAAAALIDAYVRENKFFVALKLLNGLGVSAIQPIVLTFRGTEACVPLRLTAIAANPDMPVLVWVLGTTRVAPRGFLELKIDEARINWFSGGFNYSGPKGLVSLAANEAGGHAFVTEYAGPAAIAAGSVYTNGQINLAQLRASMTPPAYVQAIIGMGLANDPLMMGLLQKYIPMPDAVKALNITPSQFYGNLANYWNQFAFPPFDLPGLTDAIDASIVKPRVDAQMMIDGHSYLTRLNTFISPEEMDKDPFFFESEDLPNLSNIHTATIRTLCGNQQYLACNAPVRLELADGRMVWLRAGTKGMSCTGNGYDLADLDALPAAESAWEREVMGEGNQILSNSAKITTAIDAHNRKYPTEADQFPMTGAAGMGGATGAGGALGGGSGVSGGGTSGAGTSGGHAGSIGKNLAGGDGGCGCDVGGGAGGPTLVGLAAMLAGLTRRRGRAHARR